MSGTLAVYKRTSPTQRELLANLRSSKAKWLYTELELRNTLRSIQVELEATQGYTDRGLAVDDVLIKPGPCRSKPGIKLI